ncbi:RHS repeat domain-containing protein [Teredinibacter turnerae]|uniref:RHS repeat domain-containing protein n=1 Tax=Teredinibacter turnerae TaxID=2426 RepID=UPI00039F54CC|nr:RHS repeat-associated core domain-containing protein [Teredinibacter turnerae]
MKKIFWIISFVLCSLQSFADEGIQPPDFNFVDKNGVNLLLGTYKLPDLDFNIGSSGSGLSHISHVKGHNNIGVATVRFIKMMRNRDEGPYIMRASYNGATIQFEIGGKYLAGDAYVTWAANNVYARNGRAHLSCDGSGDTFPIMGAGTCVMTLADGTEVTYIKPSSGKMRISTVVKPDGEIVSYYYEEISNPKRIYRSVSSSLGWMLKYTYEYDPSDDTKLVYSKVVGLNSGQSYCEIWDRSCFLAEGHYISTEKVVNGDTTTLKKNGIAVLSYSESVTDTGRTVTIQYPSGREKTIGFTSAEDDGEEKVARITVGHSTWLYSYPNSKKVVVENPDQTTYSAAFTGLGEISTFVSETGLVTDYDYYSLGDYDYNYEERLKSISTTGQPTSTFFYDDRGNITKRVISSTDGTPDLVIQAEYPEDCSNRKTCNKPYRTTAENGLVTSYEYYPEHGGIHKVKVERTDGDPITTTYGYTQYTPTIIMQGSQSPVWRLTSISSCRTMGWGACVGTDDERLVQYTYSGENVLMHSHTESLGSGLYESASTTNYDDLGRITSRDGPLPGSSDSVWTYYDTQGRPYGTIGVDPDGAGPLPRSATKYRYDSDGRNYRTEYGTTTVLGIEAIDQLSVRRAEEFNFSSLHGLPISKYVYGDSGWARVAFEQMSYDQNLRLECQAQRLNAAYWTYLSGSLNACEMGPDGADGPDRITHFSYTNDGKLESQQSGYGTSFVRTDIRNIYDELDGSLKRVVDAAGNETEYRYDGFGRVDRVCYPGATPGSINYSDCEILKYRADGLLQYTKNRAGAQLNRSYDDMGRVKFLSGAHGSTTIYDNYGNITSITANGFTQTDTYNALGMLLSSEQPMGAVAYQYDDYGRRQKMTYPGSDGFAVTYTYDDASRLKTINPIYSNAKVTLVYDELGRRKELLRAGAGKTQYNYNGKLELESLEHSGLVKETYSYTAGQQLKTKSISDTRFGYEKPPVYSYLSFSSNHLNQLSAIYYTPLDYTNLGSFEGGYGGDFGYNVKNQLTSASVENRTINLSYDPSDRLLNVTEGGESTKFLYDGNNVIAEYDENGSLLRRYVHGGAIDEPLMWFEGPNGTSARYLYQDRIGSVVAVTNSTGSLLTAVRYDAYGKTQFSNQSYKTRFGFQGQMYLPEVDVYHFKSRAYFPKFGRFLQPDTVGYADGLNMYTFVHNDPVNNVDPWGTETDRCGNDLSMTKDVYCEETISYGYATDSRMETSMGWMESQFRIFGGGSFWDNPGGHLPSLPDGVVNFAAGWGDSLSFGLTSLARDGLGIDGGVDPTTGEYLGGVGFGVVNGLAVGWAAGLNGGARSVFWSGTGNMERAASMGVSLERTFIGSMMNRAGDRVPYFMWKAASATFAMNASGSAIKVGQYSGNIWRTIEQPILNFRNVPFSVVP